jgi:FAD binding domain/D-arabinono-1,4-lactone oxidase
MPNQIVNYDGSITATPQQLVYPETVDQIQAILRDSSTYPSPVRAMGSYHSLTPCVSSDSTILNMTKMAQVVAIDSTGLTFTAQAGMSILDASKALRALNLQLMLNIEIGNMTLGSAACCHSKDGLDGIEFGQVSSYVIAMRWVTPAGDLAEASEQGNPDLLHTMRSSYGLCGVIYEVTLRIKPIETLHLTYLPRPVDDLTQDEVDNLLDNSEGLVCWTVGRTSIFQQRHRVAEPNILSTLLADIRRSLWNFEGAFLGQLIDRFAQDQSLREALQQGDFDAAKLLYSTLHLLGGITILAPDKIINYDNTPDNAKYAFTFWAFPRSAWLATLRAYLDFADQYFKTTGFRCNMPLGAYHIHLDTSSLLSYTYDEEIFSLDPIHASTDNTAWLAFLSAFNDFAFQNHGIPLLNQSPLVQRQHVEAAYGQRWLQFSAAVRAADPGGRMLNPFFAGLLSPENP